MSIDRLYLIGAGGHAAVVLDAFRCTDDKAEVVVFDQDPARDKTKLLDRPVTAPFDASAVGPINFHVAIGHNRVRHSMVGAISAVGGEPCTIVHPAASVSRFSVIGSASFVAAGAIISARTAIARGVIVNHNAVIDHDCAIMEFSHIAPGAVLGGNVTIGPRSLIGANSTVLPGITIGSDVVVGAGSTITKNIPDGDVWTGAAAFRKVSNNND